MNPLQTSYEAVYGILEDYMEIVLQFGFVTLFSIILPMVPFLAYVSNTFEVRREQVEKTADFLKF